MKIINRIMNFIVHNFFKVIAMLVFTLLYRVRFIDTKNIPKKGGFLAMGNHASFWDPPLLGSGTWRRQFMFMARDSLFRFPVWGQMLKWMGAFPVKRGKVDRNAWSALIDNVNSGYPVTFFPEGTRTPDGEIQDGKPGTGMLVYQAKAKVLPVYIHGAYEIWPKGRKVPKLFKKIDVVYGEPLTFNEYYDKEPSKEVYLKITKKIIDTLRSMKIKHVEMLRAKKK